ncbi:hypothetical protein [Ramlibacter sp.]|uniref:hypothetical protein n=1 Tax=Ramlibacter sp. TaxID=1917967 RepID=UPI003D138F97
MAMEQVGAAKCEQVFLESLLASNYMAFQKGMLSVGAQSIQWSSFSDSNHLVNNFVAGGGKQLLIGIGKSSLLDRRRKRSHGDDEIWAQIEDAACEAMSFKEWARKNENQPVFREVLVSYCSHLERFLKSVGVVFDLAGCGSAQESLRRQIFVPGPELRRSSERVESEWGKRLPQNENRAQRFFQQYLAPRNPDPDTFPLSLVEESAWATCHATFKIRNAIVHSMARPHEQVELGASTFHPGWDIELKADDLRLVAGAFASIAWPFSPLSRIL